MRTSQSGVDLIKYFEGFRAKAYLDEAGIWTIGYGHTKNVHSAMSISEQEGEALLRSDLIEAESGVERVVKYKPTQNEFDAMVSLCYNIGRGAFAKSSVALFFNKANLVEAAASFLLWNKVRKDGVLVKSNVLDRRRKIEFELFKTGEYYAPRNA